jgi:hypothetical protein
MLLSAVHLVSLTKTALKDISDVLDPATVKKAWLQTKLSYFKQKGAFSRSDLLTYRIAWMRKFFVNNYLRILTGKQPE